MAKRKRNGWIEWIIALLVALGLAFVVRTYFFAPIIVEGPSMQPTLHDRDQMIVNKFSYHLHEPNRFDVVVFHAVEQKDFIKRVIGLPGEHVEVKDDTLYIDGEKMDEPFLNGEKERLQSGETLTDDFLLEELPGENQTIPDGYVLVLGDNRQNSTDSRTLGLISEEQIVGKTNLVYWPLDRFHILKE